LNLKILTNLFDSQNLHFVTHPLRLIHKDIFRNQLGIIFIWCDHKNLKPGLFSRFRQCPDHIIGFETLLFENWDSVTLDNITDIRN